MEILCAAIAKDSMRCHLDGLHGPDVVEHGTAVPFALGVMNKRADVNRLARVADSRAQYQRYVLYNLRKVFDLKIEQ